MVFTACKKTFEEFVDCLVLTGCMQKDRRSVRECLKDRTAMNECAPQRLRYFQCRSGQLNPRSRIQGNKLADRYIATENENSSDSTESSNPEVGQPSVESTSETQK